jgi:hypothetical protein
VPGGRAIQKPGAANQGAGIQIGVGKDMEIKTCGTCKYKDVLGREEPCRSCRDISTCAKEPNYTNWEPGPGTRTPEKDEKIINEEMTLELKMEAELSEEQKAEICGFKYPRKRILTLAVPKYEHESSKYPEQIRVSFADGHTAVYDLRVDQPAPQIVESIKIIRRMRQGYVNQPMRRRRNRR